jgi:hypothetical protein
MLGATPQLLASAQPRSTVAQEQYKSLLTGLQAVGQVKGWKVQQIVYVGGTCGSFYVEEVLFIGTQFSNLSTAVDTSAAAACNAWCVCVCFFFGGLASCGCLRPPRFHLCPSSPFGHVRFTSPLHPGFYYTHLR